LLKFFSAHLLNCWAREVFDALFWHGKNVVEFRVIMIRNCLLTSRPSENKKPALIIIIPDQSPDL
jgi:hypothetical protein